MFYLDVCETLILLPTVVQYTQLDFENKEFRNYLNFLIARREYLYVSD